MCHNPTAPKALILGYKGYHQTFLHEQEINPNAHMLIILKSTQHILGVNLGPADKQCANRSVDVLDKTSK